ncbi:MAG: glycosyltransferase family 2 protein [Coriobacteriales bacterium]|jgi:GT2 family glycosyltransferase|nr:glycosyltransferase family 2 protein [Coriobacteriales bacterium]
MSGNGKASASIVTFNNLAHVTELLGSMRRCLDLQKLDVFMSDNASSDGTVEFVEERYPQIRVLRNPRNLGFGAAHNQVLPLLHSQYHVLINPDIVFVEDALAPLFAYLDDHPDVAMVTPCIRNPDGSVQELPRLRPRLKYLLARRFEGHFAWARHLCREYVRADERFEEPTDIETCTGSFCVIRTEVFERIGGFDERFFLYFEDNDLSERASEYGRLVLCPQTQVIHHYQRAAMVSRRALASQIRSMVRYFNKYGWR